MAKEILQGSMNHFGPRVAEEHNMMEFGLPVRTLVVPLKAVASVARVDTAPLANDTVNLIPPYSLILSAHLFTTVDWVTDTSEELDIGLIADDGSGYDDDALIVVADAATADAGEWVTGSGDAIGASVGAKPVRVTGELGAAHASNAGAGLVVVRYIPAPVDITA